uniref:Uncharacterized protein n=1 Tax=Myoviridae sp. ctcyQ27 TaxID=2825139 RepID=A0A8S5UFC0_9CAUD|nr:MAG TPA: hypothetical protein [Myoviridae sp. ctcyQ27]
MGYSLFKNKRTLKHPYMGNYPYMDFIFKNI